MWKQNPKRCFQRQNQKWRGCHLNCRRLMDVFLLIVIALVFYNGLFHILGLCTLHVLYILYMYCIDNIMYTVMTWHDFWLCVMSQWVWRNRLCKECEDTVGFEQQCRRFRHPCQGLRQKRQKIKRSRRMIPLRVRLEFSPMFEKPTKVKLACILLAFTAVVNKRRLMEWNQKVSQTQKSNNARTTQEPAIRALAVV